MWHHSFLARSVSLLLCWFRQLPEMKTSKSSASVGSSLSSTSPISTLTSKNNKVIESRYKQQFTPSRNFNKLNCVTVTDDYSLQISSYSMISFPYDLDIHSNNYYQHHWTVRFEKNDLDDFLGIYLINKMNENVYASYQIKIKKQKNKNSNGNHHQTNNEKDKKKINGGRSRRRRAEEKEGEEKRIREGEGKRRDVDVDGDGDFVWSDPDGELCFTSYGTGDHYWGTDELISLSDLEDPRNNFVVNDQLHLEISITALVSDELRILPPSSSAIPGLGSSDHHEDNEMLSSSNGPQGISIGSSLEKATKQLNHLSEQMSQKVRLLSEDALLQDKLIHARLESQSSSGGMMTMQSLSSPAGDVGSESPAKSVQTTSHVSVQHHNLK
jgi:hypothetical protein